ncbi:17-beta-hydroxysteroid dehydrogenase type 6-like [Varroa jacobsoni]|uniref:Uncharacterized protein n=1 Tax=Varroa destructor TaxID=109461 RepID=A0A7M7L0B3_VARDE|nr:17-beta-hydroxysteroid dehydrogenase type 6-like isoform X2 [Varroa destructor]XP_022689335.1 17-beta-hydroxysteroid dehydrogenase type 6-like [Varroa jacobsoni]
MAVENQVKLYASIFGGLCVAVLFLPYAWISVQLAGAICLLSMVARRITTEYNRQTGKTPVSSIDKAIFITGCDSGFGYGLVKRLDKLGYRVFAGCLYPDGEGAAKLKSETSNEVTILPLDVTKDESVDAAFETITKSLKNRKLWAVVGNAGVCYAGELEWGNLDWLTRTFDINVIGLVRSIRPFLPLLRRSKGRVICTTSLWGHYAIPPAVPYCMSKAAARYFVDGLRREMKKFGVKCISMEPNVYKTNLTDHTLLIEMMRKAWNQTPESIRKDYGETYFRKETEYLSAHLNEGRTQVDEVLDDFVEAVTAQHPKYAYHPDGWVRGLFWRLALIAPPALQDEIINHIAQPNEFVAFRRNSKKQG